MNTKKNVTAAREAARVARRLLKAAGLQDDVLLIKYDNTYDGFDKDTVEDMRDQYGDNVITQQKKTSILRRLLEAFVNPFTIVLAVLAVISFFTGDLPAVVIVLVMVTISGLLRFVQEFRSSVAAQKLSEMVETTAAVQRQVVDEETGKTVSAKVEIPMDELVVGDVVYLAAGDMVPADLRVLQAKDLFISQSSLTGESEPVEKIPGPVGGKHSNGVRRVVFLAHPAGTGFVHGTIPRGLVRGIAVVANPGRPHDQDAETPLHPQQGLVAGHGAHHPRHRRRHDHPVHRGRAVVGNGAPPARLFRIVGGDDPVLHAARHRLQESLRPPLRRAVVGR